MTRAPITCLPVDSEAAADETRRVFDLVDADASGDIDAHELRVGLEALGLPAGAPQVAEVLRRYDEDASRRLDLREFRALVRDIQRFRMGQIASAEQRQHEQQQRPATRPAR